MKLAILIASSEYNKYKPLNACKNDLELINSLLENSKEFSKILYSLNEDASQVQNKIIDFVNEHKNKEIQQVFFYFSGHGYRSDKNYHFCFKNTDSQFLETTTINNDELDNYLRELSASVTIKIVDACYSGEHYIKNTENEDIIFTKNKKGFKDLFFLYSSLSTEISEADQEHSKFTKLLIKAINSEISKNKISLATIWKYISDYSKKDLNHEPQIICQGGALTYLFNDINTIKSLIQNFEKTNDDFEQNTIDNSKQDNTENLSFFDQVYKQAQLYCDQPTALTKIHDFIQCITKIQFSKEINTLFDIHNEFSNFLYNSSFIGEWLQKNQLTDDWLATVVYDTKIEEEKKYIKYPKKPSELDNIIFRASSLFPNKPYEWKLENVPVEKSVITGVKKTIKLDNDSIEFYFSPKKDLLNLSNYSAYFTYLFSKKSIVVFFGVTRLKSHNWAYVKQKKYTSWNSSKFDLKTFKKEQLEEIISFINDFIIDDIKNKLSL